MAWLPVGLTTLLPRGAAPDAESVRGWLFVTRRSGACHYCPCCIPMYLASLAAPVTAAQRVDVDMGRDV